MLVSLFLWSCGLPAFLNLPKIEDFISIQAEDFTFTVDTEKLNLTYDAQGIILSYRVSVNKPTVVPGYSYSYSDSKPVLFNNQEKVDIGVLLSPDTLIYFDLYYTSSDNIVSLSSGDSFNKDSDEISISTDLDKYYIQFFVQYYADHQGESISTTKYVYLGYIYVDE